MGVVEEGADRAPRKVDRLALSDGLVAFTPREGERHAVMALRGWTISRNRQDYRRDGKTEVWDFDGAVIKVDQDGNAALVFGRVYSSIDQGIPLRDAAISFVSKSDGTVKIVFPESASHSFEDRTKPYEVTLSRRGDPVKLPISPSADSRALQQRLLARGSTGRFGRR